MAALAGGDGVRGAVLCGVPFLHPALWPEDAGQGGRTGITNYRKRKFNFQALG